MAPLGVRDVALLARRAVEDRVLALRQRRVVHHGRAQQQRGAKQRRHVRRVHVVKRREERGLARRGGVLHAEVVPDGCVHEPGAAGLPRGAHVRRHWVERGHAAQAHRAVAHVQGRGRVDGERAGKALAPRGQPRRVRARKRRRGLGRARHVLYQARHLQGCRALLPPGAHVARPRPALQLDHGVPYGREAGQVVPAARTARHVVRHHHRGHARRDSAAAVRAARAAGAHVARVQLRAVRRRKRQPLVRGDGRVEAGGPAAHVVRRKRCGRAKATAPETRKVPRHRRRSVVCLKCAHPLRQASHVTPPARRSGAPRRRRRVSPRGQSPGTGCGSSRT